LAIASCKGSYPYKLAPLISRSSILAPSSERGQGTTPLAARLKRAGFLVFTQSRYLDRIQILNWTSPASQIRNWKSHIRRVQAMHRLRSDKKGTKESLLLCLSFFLPCLDEVACIDPVAFDQ